MRWQTLTSLAYGATGLMYFNCKWHACHVPTDTSIDLFHGTFSMVDPTTMHALYLLPQIHQERSSTPTARWGRWPSAHGTSTRCCLPTRLTSCMQPPPMCGWCQLVAPRGPSRATTVVCSSWVYTRTCSDRSWSAASGYRTVGWLHSFTTRPGRRRPESR